VITVSSFPEVPARRRHLIAVVAVVATLVLVLAWATSTRGSLHGSVILAGGCRDISKPDAPPSSACSSTPVNGATVVISSADGRMLLGRTDDRGSFRMLLPAGTYMVGAWVLSWRGIAANGSRGIPITGESTLSPVRIVSGANARTEITLAWFADRQ